MCQDVCPYNGPGTPAPWPELAPAAGVGPRLDLASTLSLRDDAAFAARFAGTPLTRPGRAGLLRNAAVAARNVGAPCGAARAGFGGRGGRVRARAARAVGPGGARPGRRPRPGRAGAALGPDAAVVAQAVRVLEGPA